MLQILFLNILNQTSNKLRRENRGKENWFSIKKGETEQKRRIYESLLNVNKKYIFFREELNLKNVFQLFLK